MVCCVCGLVGIICGRSRWWLWLNCFSWYVICWFYVCWIGVYSCRLYWMGKRLSRIFVKGICILFVNGRRVICWIWFCWCWYVVFMVICWCVMLLEKWWFSVVCWCIVWNRLIMVSYCIICGCLLMCYLWYLKVRDCLVIRF